MLRAAALTCLLFAGCLLGSALAIVLGAAIFGHTGTGMVVALAAELALFLAGGVASFRLAKVARRSSPLGWGAFLGFLVAILALSVPLVIATALSFDH